MSQALPDPATLVPKGSRHILQSIPPIEETGDLPEEQGKPSTRWSSLEGIDLRALQRHRRCRPSELLQAGLQLGDLAGGQQVRHVAARDHPAGKVEACARK